MIVWTYRGQKRPDFAVEPGPGQESVWDYPRPPALEPCTRRIRVETDYEDIATSDTSYRLKETASPPSFYLPPDCINWDQLEPTDDVSMCEWKGIARYWSLKSKPGVPVAWGYPNPGAGFEPIKDYVCFYPGRVACYVDDQRVRPQPGVFYGGWITADVVGPFKGEPGTQNW